uniref:TOR n=1 Tax=Arundo donax TaxID=35708 RepID=A0A0A9FCB9_ARUDO
MGGAKRRRLIEEVVEKLLIAAVADADVGVRSSVFKALYRNPTFDDFLAQADILTSIFVALNDEADCLKKILHMYFLPFVAILYSCSHILIRVWIANVERKVLDYWVA